MPNPAWKVLLKINCIVLKQYFGFFTPTLRSPSQFSPANLQVFLLSVPPTNWEPAMWQLEGTVYGRTTAHCWCSTPCQLSPCFFFCATAVPHVITALSISVCRQVPLNCSRLKFIPKVCLFQMSVYGRKAKF